MCISSVSKIYGFICAKNVRSKCVKMTKIIYDVHPAEGGRGQSKLGVLATRRRRSRKNEK